MNRIQPALLVLAAGMGSRYGGLKQIDPVGPGGETVLDYAVFDALRAGFGKVVFVIRRDFAKSFQDVVYAKYAGRIAVETVFQESADLPKIDGTVAAREKPWGTGHAVWCARGAIREPFAVINADDFYGADAFQLLGKFLVNRSGAGQYAMVGYRLAGTLSEHGSVSRGVCATGPDGRLSSIVEETGIVATDVGPGKKYSGQEIVSMNCWGFTPDLFPALEERLRGFLLSRGSDAKAEFYLPAAVSSLISSGEAVVSVLPSAGSWFGITHRDDRPRVARAIEGLVAAGTYPPILFP